MAQRQTVKGGWHGQFPTLGSRYGGMVYVAPYEVWRARAVDKRGSPRVCSAAQGAPKSLSPCLAQSVSSFCPVFDSGQCPSYWLMLQTKSMGPKACNRHDGSLSLTKMLCLNILWIYCPAFTLCYGQRPFLLHWKMPTSIMHFFLSCWGTISDFCIDDPDLIKLFRADLQVRSLRWDRRVAKHD